MNGMRTCRGKYKYKNKSKIGMTLKLSIKAHPKTSQNILLISLFSELKDYFMILQPVLRNKKGQPTTHNGQLRSPICYPPFPISKL